MGLNICQRIEFGFRVPESIIERALGTMIPATTHTEPRWDQKTGDRVDDAVVIDVPARVAYCFESTVAGDMEELMDRMDEKLPGIRVYRGGDPHDNDEESDDAFFSFVIERSMANKKPIDHGSEFDFDRDVPIPPDLLERLQTVAMILRSWRIDPGQALVLNEVSISH